jgi:hypothetical protein
MVAAPLHGPDADAGAYVLLSFYVSKKITANCCTRFLEL